MTINNSISLDYKTSTENLSSCIGSPPITAELVRPEDIRAPEVYKRFQNAEKKEVFKQKLLQNLESALLSVHTPEKAQEMKARFIELAQHLDDHGAVILGAILGKSDFTKLIESYTQILDASGSKSWIHSFVNLANHPEFLTDESFNAAFLHPLLISLVSYRIGSPVRIVDARGKDAEPIAVLAQDNMLHIDNTPFNDEYKVILTWKRGEPLGPQGQNFVFLPGTHKGVRQCMMTGKDPWSSENASIFITPDSVEKMLAFQEGMTGTRSVVEVTHPDKPLTTLFAAGSLVHHRHRTEEGLARSCMILAFHSAKDNPGQLVNASRLENTAAKTDKLYQSLLGETSDEEQFLEALMSKTSAIVDLLDSMSSDVDAPEEILPEARELPAEHIKKWIDDCTIAPTVAQKKADANIVPLGQEFTHAEFVIHVGKMMSFDKHGPLDLILYPDAHEEIRKWARNQIREKNSTLLQEQIVADWGNTIVQPEASQLLMPQPLRDIAEELASIAEKNIDSGAVLNAKETIVGRDAMRSIHQLLLDLGEAVVRCEDSTSFLSTGLFIFWAADTLMRLTDSRESRVKDLGQKLLQNYIATAILVEKEKA